MKLVKFALIHCAAISVFLLAALSAQAKEDPVWGEAWNSKIGKANFTVTASSCHSSTLPINLFDNNEGNRYLTLSGAQYFPADVTLVINDTYEPEKPDLVLKKYVIYVNKGDGTARFPRDWQIFGSNDGGATWDDVPIDSRTMVTIDSYADSLYFEVDVSGNVIPYRSYRFHFLRDNGANFLEAKEIYLFGEIKEHENKILYTAKAFNGIYDGYEHGAEVAPITPNTTVQYSRTGADGSWGDTSPVFKDVGEHTIFLKLTAEGYPDALDSVKVVIEEPPRENLNITAEVRLAGGREGEPTKYREVAKSGAVGGFGDKDADVFVDGIDNQRAGWANSGTGVYDYTILDTYRPGDAVVATAVLFAVGTNNKGDGLNNFPRTFSLYGWNGELNDGAGGWELIAAFDDETNPAWTDAELSGSAYYRTVPFANRKAYRKYEFQFKSRVQMSEISLIGSIGAADASAVVALARDYDGEYDGYPHGISVDVIMPEEGAKTYYRLEETQEWSETAPTFVGPVVNTEPVYWKVEAEGLEPASGVNTVTIHDAPRANLDIGATLKSASTRSTGWNYEVTATGRSTASDGNLQNIFCGINAAGVSGDRNVWTDNKPFTLTLTVNPAYRPGEAVVVSAVVFHTDFSAVNPKEIKADTVTPEELLAQYGYYRLVHRQTGDVYQVPDEKAIGELPSQFKLEASKDGEHWRLLRNELEGEPWSYKDIVEYPAVGAVMFEHAYAPMLSRSGYRLFRFTFPKRTIISAIQLLGSIGLPPPGFQILVR